MDVKEIVDGTIENLADVGKLKKAVDEIDNVRAQLSKFECFRHEGVKAVALSKDGPICEDCTHGYEAGNIRRLGGDGGLLDTRGLSARLEERFRTKGSPRPTTNLSLALGSIIGRRAVSEANKK